MPVTGARRAGRFKGAPRVICLAAALIGFGGMARAEYRFQPGDSVRIGIDGIDESFTTKVVDSEGFVDFSRIGPTKAAGATLEELRVILGQKIAGVSISLLSEDGERRNILLESSDVRVDVAELRAIIVDGFVNAPGRVAFEPGLTARRAVALAGGVLRAPEDGTRIVSLREMHKRSALEEAAAALRLWRIDAVIAEAPEALDPKQSGDAVFGAGLDPADFATMLSVERARLVLTLKARAEMWTSLTERLEALKEREKILADLIAQYEFSAAEDDEELADVRALFEQGVAARSRLSDIRRAAVLSSARQLEARAASTAVTLEIGATRQRLAELDTTARAEDAAERAGALQTLLDARIKLETAALNLVAQGSAVAQAHGELLTTIRIYRAGTLDAAEADPDVELQPGDLVEIIAPGPD